MSWTFFGRSTDLRRFSSRLIASAPSRVMGILSDAIDSLASACNPGHSRNKMRPDAPPGARPRSGKIGKDAAWPSTGFAPPAQVRRPARVEALGSMQAPGFTVVRDRIRPVPLEGLHDLTLL